MIYLQIALLVVGAVLSVTGYRRNHRNMLLAAAIVLFLSSAGAQFATGFTEGNHGTITTWAK